MTSPFSIHALLILHITSSMDSVENALGLFSLEKRRLKGNLVNTCKYLKGSCQVNGTGLFSVDTNDRIKGNRHKLEHSWTRETINMISRIPL